MAAPVEELYLRKVRRVLEGEVRGEAMFGAMSALLTDAEQKHKFACLHQLERETKARVRRLLALLSPSAGSVAEDPAQAKLGRRAAARMAARPWGEKMEISKASLPKYVRFFVQLETHARDADERRLLEALTAHKRALQLFYEHEVAGRGAASLEPVLALLEAPPTRPTAPTASAPKLSVVRQCFSSREEALQDCRENAYFPVDYHSTASPELPVHWHATSTIGYVLAGSTYVLDSDGERVDLHAGDKLIIPAGAVHAEGEVTEPVTWLTTWAVDRPLLENVKALDPRAWPTPKPLRWTPSPEVLAKFAPPPEAKL